MYNLLFEFIKGTCLFGRVDVDRGETHPVQLSTVAAHLSAFSRAGREKVFTPSYLEGFQSHFLCYLILLLKAMVGHRHLRYYLSLLACVLA